MQLTPFLRRISQETLVRFDADETAFLERMLTQLRSKVFEVQYKDNVARQLIPIATDIAPSAETYTFPILDQHGNVKIIASGAQDIPRIDVTLTEETGKVYTIAGEYGFLLNELKEAARLGVPLPQWKTRASRRAIEDGIDEMFFKGNLVGSTTPLTGLVNNAAVEALGIYGSLTHWVAATAGETIAQEMHSFVNTIPIATGQKFRPNTLALPPSRYNVAAQARVGDTSETALSFFLRTSPYISNVVAWHKLEDAGATTLDRAVAYMRDPEVLEGVLPEDYMQMAPQLRGLEMVTICTARVGGVKVYQPSAIKYGDFADS
jgi:hypothetical protein